MIAAIYLEEGPRRTFACAVDWPGWCRVAHDDAAAIHLLASYAARYAVIAAEAAVDFPPGGGPPIAPDDVEVLEVVRGSAATDFGVPGAVPTLDLATLDATTAQRHADLVAAAWRVFERVAADAPAELRKGPRGGGRDRDEIAAHVAESERSYARKLGVRFTPSRFAEPDGPAAMRSELLDVLKSARDGAPLTPKGWPPRYAARRIAWHVLDHLWEIEDKSV